jgi:8-oxo-dGTP diphosphatase
MKRGKDYIGVAVGVAVFNDEGKIFITKRGQGASNDRGKWEIPGGGVEFGETREEAVRREIKEENDIDVEVVDILHSSDHILPEEGQHWVTTTYICKHVGGEPKTMEPEKCEAVGWFTIDEAEQLDLSGITKHDLEAIKAKYPEGYKSV